MPDQQKIRDLLSKYVNGNENPTFNKMVERDTTPGLYDPAKLEAITDFVLYYESHKWEDENDDPYAVPDDAPGLWQC